MAASLYFRVWMLRSAKTFVAGFPDAINFWKIPDALQMFWKTSLVKMVALSETWHLRTHCVKIFLIILNSSIVNIEVGAEANCLFCFYLRYVKFDVFISQHNCYPWQTINIRVINTFLENNCIIESKKEYCVVIVSSLEFLSAGKICGPRVNCQ